MKVTNCKCEKNQRVFFVCLFCLLCFGFDLFLKSFPGTEKIVQWLRNS